MYKLLSATPSPYARKVRVALIEKGIPFELITEVPWDATTETPRYNPLEKLPVLVPDGGGEPVYESHYILEYLEAKHPDPPLVPSDVDDRLAARRLEVLSDGVCDALVLMLFEKMRAAEAQSVEWLARQRRKVDGGLLAIAERVSGRDFAIGDGFTLGDVAAVTVTGYIAVRWPDMDWRDRHPGLAAYAERLEQRPSFAATRPTVQGITDKVV
jgi:glutathione S-transferase